MQNASCLKAIVPEEENASFYNQLSGCRSTKERDVLSGSSTACGHPHPSKFPERLSKQCLKVSLKSFDFTASLTASSDFVLPQCKLHIITQRLFRQEESWMELWCLGCANASEQEPLRSSQWLCSEDRLCDILSRCQQQGVIRFAACPRSDEKLLWSGAKSTMHTSCNAHGSAIGLHDMMTGTRLSTPDPGPNLTRQWTQTLYERTSISV